MKRATVFINRKSEYVCSFPFDPYRVQSLKDIIPTWARRWDNDLKSWIISADQYDRIKTIFPELQIPRIEFEETTEQRILTLKYIGKTKYRGDDQASALGYVDGGWNVVFPEDVLRLWFEGFGDFRESTYYGLLGIQKNASFEQIKIGYRRMAKQWHPDVCKETNANEMFLKIREAYEILSNQDKRARYDFGLMYSGIVEDKTTILGGYRPVLRCGWVKCDGKPILDKFVVQKILDWQDIIVDGLTLVTSWVMGENEPREQWV